MNPQSASGKHPHVDLGFAAELAALKDRLGLGYAEIAERSGVSKSYLIDLVKGHRGATWPSQEIVDKIAAGLGVPSDHFTVTKARVVLEEPDVLNVAYTKAKNVRRLREKRRVTRSAA